LKVLLIEDEKTLAYEVEAFLKKAFYICDLAHTARKGLEMLGVNPYDFVLLDLGLPDLDGLKVLQEAKKLNPDAAYIILTARGNIEDRIVGWIWVLMIICPNPFPCSNYKAECRQYPEGSLTSIRMSLIWANLRSIFKSG
jgi:DNA-binding response OmpR family regulator